MHNNCDGCYIKEDVVTCSHYNLNGECPCTNCLVKVTCQDNQGDCELYDSWFSVVNPEIYKQSLIKEES